MRDLQRRLAEAEAIIQALLSGQIDAVVDATSGMPVLLATADLVERARALEHQAGVLTEQAAFLELAPSA
ncbi:MAG TPA: hypothetical protein VL225_09650, partial [Vicinamibacterales bacterium]|nr:hypothetical protein [Vicinamibacterales bacterium]